MKPDFPLLLRAYRHDRCLTQEELAHRAGTSVRTIRNLELGRVRCPRRSSLRAICAGLGLTAAAAEELMQVATAASRREPSGSQGPPPAPIAAVPGVVRLEPGAEIRFVVRRRVIAGVDSIEIGVDEPELPMAADRGTRANCRSTAWSPEGL